MTTASAGKLDRRTLLTGAGAAAGLLAASRLPGAWAAPAPNDRYPFTLGVASGDPLPDGIVLWTRLAPAGIEQGMPLGDVPVEWQLARDSRFAQVIRRGTVTARPAQGHSIHIDVRGLAPRAEYFYRFRTGRFTSPVGRTKTAPALTSPLQELRFAFVSCQDYQNGFYPAYENIAREGYDFVLHLGDYIYEYGPDEPPDPPGPRSHRGPEIITLADYRNRHLLYRQDPDLKAAHASAPFIVTFDDHEAENNYAGAIPEEGSQTPTRQAFLARRAASYQAYYEHMPLRRSSIPTGPNMLLYRRFSFGDLAQFSILDTRQYRTDQPCGDGLKERCAAALSPSQTMTGPDQEQWLLSGLGRSTRRWNVIGQQTMLAEYDFNAAPGEGPGAAIFNMDQWDGYVAARNRLLGFIAQRKPSNPIVLTGDIHSAWVHDLKANFDNEAAPTVGTEFVGTSISSAFLLAGIPAVEAARPDNPHTKFFDGYFRGYTRCVVTRDQWRTDFRTVPTTPDQQVLVRDAQASTQATFVVENGQPGAMQV